MYNSSLLQFRPSPIQMYLNLMLCLYIYGNSNLTIKIPIFSIPVHAHKPMPGLQSIGLFYIGLKCVQEKIEVCKCALTLGC